jgi:arsenite/tail-anchored protein-transporting ATPase
MRELLKKRILFFGGKGGVGKTTCASAMALAASKEGKKVLLVSTDPAHSTSDIFERQFDREEREVYPGLMGIELDADFEARRYVDDVKSNIAKLFSPAILKEAERQIELASTMPGIEEVALFDRIGDLMINRLDAYDMIVFDTAPTGHTLRLLRMPELMSSWIEALSKRRKNLLKLNEDIDKARLNPEAQPMEGDPILSTLERRKEKLEQVRIRLMQHNFTGFVLVMIPERLPIEESARAAEMLRESNVNVCGILVNRVLPDNLEGDFYRARRQQEQVYRDEIKRRFTGYPVTWIPQFETDVYGIRNLERISQMVLG